MGLDLLELLRTQLKSNIRTAQSRVRAREAPERSLAQARTESLLSPTPFWITERMEEEHRRVMEQRLGRLSRAALETMAETPIVDTVSLLTEIPFSGGFWTRLLADRLRPDDEQRLVEFGIGPYSAEIGDEILVDVFRFLHGEARFEQLGQPVGPDMNPAARFARAFGTALAPPSGMAERQQVLQGQRQQQQGPQEDVFSSTARSAGQAVVGALTPRGRYIDPQTGRVYTEGTGPQAPAAAVAQTQAVTPGYTEPFGGPQPSSDALLSRMGQVGLTARPMALEDGNIYLTDTDESGSIIIGMRVRDAQENQWWEPVGRASDPRQAQAVQRNASLFRPESLLTWESERTKLTATIAHLTAQTTLANAQAYASGVQADVARGQLSLAQGMMAVEKRLKEAQAENYESEARLKAFEETLLPIARKTRLLTLAKAQLEHDLLQRSGPLQLQRLEEGIASLREERAERQRQRQRQQAGDELGALVYPQLLSLLGGVVRPAAEVAASGVPAAPVPSPDALFDALAGGAGTTTADPAAQVAWSLFARDALGAGAVGGELPAEEDEEGF